MLTLRITSQLSCFDILFRNVWNLSLCKDVVVQIENTAQNSKANHIIKYYIIKPSLKFLHIMSYKSNSIAVNLKEYMYH